AGRRVKAIPGRFDNRWVIFLADLPSPEELRRTGISRVILVQSGQDVMPDLEPILRKYRKGGLEILLRDINQPGPAVEMTLRERNKLADGFRSAFRTFRYRRRFDGSYGGVIPEPSHG